MSKITYENKVAINVNSDIADINKCNASDLNEIKQVVNTNDDNTTNNSNAIGTLSSLNTTNKSNLVSAINENKNSLDTLIQSGSNDNGSYVKYADGTMICYGTWNIGNISFISAVGAVYNVSINSRHMFPVSFINKPVMTFSAYENTEDYGLLLQVCPKRDSITSQDFGSIDVISITQVSAHLAIDYIAIGKWK